MQTVTATFIAMTRAEAMAFVANKRFLDFGTILRVAEAEQDEVEVFFGIGKKLTETPGFNGSELSRLIALENHQITIGEVDGLQTALDGKAALVHDHEIADVNGLETELDTLTNGVADALVKAQNLADLTDKATARGELGVYSTAQIDAQMGLKANLASPTFTGAPAAPTPDEGSNDTTIPTTAWVVGRLAPIALPTPVIAGYGVYGKSDLSGYELKNPAIFKRNALSSADGIQLLNESTTGYGSAIRFSLGYNGGYDAAKIDAENDSTGGQLRFYTTDTGVVSRVRLTIGADGKLSFSNGSTFSDPWAFMPIGVPIPVQSDLLASLIPTNDLAKGYSYIDLTAGLTGAGGYNNGKLTSESVSGSAPLNLATAVVSLASSPLVGKTVRLINTEKRFLRAGSAGTYNYDQMQLLTGAVPDLMTSWAGTLSGVFAGSFSSAAARAVGSSSSMTLNFNSSNSAGARTGTETFPKNIEARYFMRIL